MTINCKGELLSMDTPKVMGILNHTPDPFYEGSRVTEKTLLQRAETMLAHGAERPHPYFCRYSETNGKTGRQSVLTFKRHIL